MKEKIILLISIFFIGINNIYAKETEIKIIRIIMVGKLNNIPAEVVRERLRDIYV